MVYSTGRHYAPDGRGQGTEQPGGRAKIDSPVVVGDVVIHSQGKRFRARSIDSGEQRWVGPRKGSVHTQPAIGNGIGVFGVAKQGVFGFSAEDGSEVWSLTEGAATHPYPPVIVGDTAYFLAFSDPNTIVYAVDSASGEVAWTKELEGAPTTTVAVASGVLFVATRQSVYARWDG